jgi:hypothetical protein
MGLFSRESTPHRCGDHADLSTLSSAAFADAPQGLYLAVIVGLIMILAIGSILAVQLRPYTAPPEEPLGGSSNYPRLVDAAYPAGSLATIMEGGEVNVQIA